MDAVRHYRDRAPPELQGQIAAFGAQEAMHTREHLVFNRQAASRGYDFARIDTHLNARFKWARSRPRILQLAATAALEHFTAILAHTLLSDPVHLEGAAEEIQRMWRWHAIEEIEHKGVAFDTFLAATRQYSPFARWLLRCSVMFSVTILFFDYLVRGLGEFFRQDGIASFRTWLRFARFAFAQPGMLRHLMGSYLTYYLPGFHPWRLDDRALISAAEVALQGGHASA